MFFNGFKEKAHTIHGDIVKQNHIRCLLNFLIFVLIAFFNTQLLPFLKKIGYSNIERNSILAMNAIFCIVIQIGFAYACDHFQKMKKLFMFVFLFLFLFGNGMFLISKQQFFFHIMITSLMAAMVKVATGLIETWMLYLDKKQYGIYCSFGALGLCVGAPLAGFIVDTFSYFGLFISSIVVCLLLFLCALYCDDISYSEKMDFKQFLKIFKNKEYMYMVLIYVLIYIVGMADQYVVIDKMLKLKANGFMIGVKWAIQSLMEIPFFLFANTLLKKYRAETLLKFAIVMYGIKFMLYGWANSVVFILLASILQIVTLPIVAYTSKLILANIMPSIKASSQMIAMAFFFGGSAFITPLVTALMIPKLGFDYTLYAFAIFTCIPLLLLLCKKHILH